MRGRITSNDANSPLRLPIRVRGLPPPAYTILPHGVTDAAFSMLSGVVVVDGRTLSLIGADGHISSITLPDDARPSISMA